MTGPKKSPRCHSPCVPTAGGPFPGQENDAQLSATKPGGSSTAPAQPIDQQMPEPGSAPHQPGLQRGRDGCLWLSQHQSCGSLPPHCSPRQIGQKAEAKPQHRKLLQSPAGCSHHLTGTQNDPSCTAGTISDPLSTGSRVPKHQQPPKNLISSPQSSLWAGARWL